MRRPAALVLSLVLVLTACGNGSGSAGPTAREIVVTTSDELRFDPMTISAQPGERVVLVVSNPGRLDHELVMGSPAYLDAHAEGGDHESGHGDGGASVATAAGKTMRLTFTMPEGDPPSYACFVDRHDRAGMTGTVTYV